jgi:hypothetical protein
MSVADFQCALSALIASPRLCLQLRAGDEGVLAPYELSARERRRLETVVRQPGMSVSCSIYRANRLTAITSGLPFTCLLLGEDLAPLLDRFWDGEQGDMQFGPEVERFGRFLEAELTLLPGPYREEVLAFELALNALRHRDGTAMVRFGHDPRAVLGALAEGRIPAAVESVGHDVVVCGRAGEVTVRVVSTGASAAAPQRSELR